VIAGAAAAITELRLQAQRALRGLLRAWHAARDQGLPEIPEPVREPLVTEFRHAVLAGLSDVPRIPWNPPAPPPHHRDTTAGQDRYHSPRTGVNA
jgi:hypothetical protein